jgi:hypothetical protein
MQTTSQSVVKLETSFLFAGHTTSGVDLQCGALRLSCAGHTSQATCASCKGDAVLSSTKHCMPHDAGLLIKVTQQLA